MRAKKYLVILFFLLLGMSQVFAEHFKKDTPVNGGGYNGPDMEGLSVPIGFDQNGVRAYVLNRAINKCLQNMIFKAYTSAFPSKIKTKVKSKIYIGIRYLSPIEDDKDDYTYIEFFGRKESDTSISLIRNNQSLRFFFPRVKPETIWNDTKVFNKLFISILDKRYKEESIIVTKNDFPMLKFKKASADSYDVFGRGFSGEGFLQGLEFSHYDKTISFLNLKTKLPAQLTINAQEYVDCIIGGLNRDE